MMRKTLILISSFVSAIAIAGGGSVVGNGAGLVENNFQYAYSTLSSMINNCFALENCSLTPSEEAMLIKIQNVIYYNSANADRLKFVSEKDQPGFFTTGPNEEHRIAKTGLTPDSPIYVNVDLLYDENGKPTLEYPRIISILTHELGHQTGEENHAMLDILASKIQKAVSQKMASHWMDFGNPVQSIEILVLNYSQPIHSSEILVAWQKVGSKKISTDLAPHLKCSSPADSLSGIQISNGHYYMTDTEHTENPRIGFAMWVQLFCYSSTDKVVRIEKASAKIEILKDLGVEVIEVKKLF